jgi:hypothetical protein
MPKGSRDEDTTLLSMALVGFEIEKQKIEQKIAELRARVGGRPIPAGSKSDSMATTSESTPGRRTLSAAARKRIAAAQKKRWAEHRRKLAVAAE